MKFNIELTVLEKKYSHDSNGSFEPSVEFSIFRDLIESLYIGDNKSIKKLDKRISSIGEVFTQYQDETKYSINKTDFLVETKTLDVDDPKDNNGNVIKKYFINQLAGSTIEKHEIIELTTNKQSFVYTFEQTGQKWILYFIADDQKFQRIFKIFKGPENPKIVVSFVFENGKDTITFTQQNTEYFKLINIDKSNLESLQVVYGVQEGSNWGTIIETFEDKGDKLALLDTLIFSCKEHRKNENERAVEAEKALRLQKKLEKLSPHMVPTKGRIIDKTSLNNINIEPEDIERFIIFRKVKTNFKTHKVYLKPKEDVQTLIHSFFNLNDIHVKEITPFNMISLKVAENNGIRTVTYNNKKYRTEQKSEKIGVVTINKKAYEVDSKEIVEKRAKKINNPFINSKFLNQLEYEYKNYSFNPVGLLKEYKENDNTADKVDDNNTINVLYVKEKTSNVSAWYNIGTLDVDEVISNLFPINIELMFGFDRDNHIDNSTRSSIRFTMTANSNKYEPEENMNIAETIRYENKEIDKNQFSQSLDKIEDVYKTAKDFYNNEFDNDGNFNETNWNKFLQSVENLKTIDNENTIYSYVLFLMGFSNHDLYSEDLKNLKNTINEYDRGTKSIDETGNEIDDFLNMIEKIKSFVEYMRDSERLKENHHNDQMAQLREIMSNHNTYIKEVTDKNQKRPADREVSLLMLAGFYKKKNEKEQAEYLESFFK